jgi:hypothetical protein
VLVRFCNNGHRIIDKDIKLCPDCGAKLYEGCVQCDKSWDYCLCPSWPIRLFVYSRPQIWWLLQNGLTWTAGVDGFTDVVQTSVAHNAPFISESEIIAEVDWRLKKCGKLGRILRNNALNFDATKGINDLEWELLLTLNFCCGRERHFKKDKDGKKVLLSLAEWTRDKNKNHNNVIKT